MIRPGEGAWRRSLLAAAALVLAPAATARAEPAPERERERAKAPPPVRVLVAPFDSVADGAASLEPIERLVAQALAALPRIEVVAPTVAPRARGRKRARPAPRARSCEGDEPCLAGLGRGAGAARVVSGEISEIGDRQVVYLKVVEVEGVRESGTTTLVLPEDARGREAEARAAAYRLLAPRAYLGTLALAVDVPGAAIYVDGRRAGRAPRPPLRVRVGTRAVRVTHPQYRDFVRFVDVRFDETTEIAVDLRAYPVVRDEMRQEAGLRGLGAAGREPTPWYQEWWAIAGAATAVAVVTTAVVALTGSEIARDRKVTIGTD